MNEMCYRMIDEENFAGGRSYGIAVCQKDALGVETPIETIPDICCDPLPIAALVETCNRLKLSKLHLSEVVEDWLDASFF